jgi:hypothetical protein
VADKRNRIRLAALANQASSSGEAMHPQEQIALGLAFGVFVGVTPWMFWSMVYILGRLIG